MNLTELRDRLPDLTIADERRLRRRLAGVRRLGDRTARQKALDRIAEDLTSAEHRITARRASVPQVTYPPLPVSERRDEIAEAIRDNQVVVVAGETGSGKTTQLPKICLELGRGVRGMIGHTQPRRLAARTVAERVAEELDTPVGGAIGYKMRFTDRVDERTLVKLMTDGILLTEIHHDPTLAQYETLIIDEAHERSLNIDFVLGFLAQLLPRRPDLKVIITSATIDPERFSRHFGDAPIVNVSGRTYPVEVRYRPAEENGEPDQVQAICRAVDELCAEGPGDVLVFLSGEREIRDAADALAADGPSGAEILPLFARLSPAEQHRVFAPHSGRRIVLATNVAETSLTVPGIRYVVDPGTARISRYSRRTKVQRLPIEPISQASARQRAGRCGRVAPGVCVRLYSEDDFAGRPEFTEPEILRTNLASVILQMIAAGLGDVAAFPFVDPPDRRSVRDALVLLHELGAIEHADGTPRLTPVGERLARLPIDPRLGRMILEAERNGCLHEVLVVTAALSIRDPRERPPDREAAAAEMHGRFTSPDSDFVSVLNLWHHVAERQREVSSSGFRRMCRSEFLSYPRIREWQDLYAQLRQVVRELGMNPRRGGETADPALVHRSLMAGLLSHLGLREGNSREYAGARGARFAVFPGSGLFSKPPRWVMAAELVDTSRLWARVVARIEPEWAEELAGHLVQRSYSEPRWDADRGAVLAQEKVTLYGVPIVASRTVNYGRVDPAASRELFIRHALVAGEWDTRHRFFHDNQTMVEQVAELEDRARRRGIVVDDETLFRFYDERVGSDVVSARHFDSWWKKTRRERPDLLTFTPELLVNPDAAGVASRDYPDTWRQGELRLPVSYRFEPGAGDDGVTVHIPLPVLNQVRAEGFDWQVPGLRTELVTALLRSLPRNVRRGLVPVGECVDVVLGRVTPMTEPLLDALERELPRLGGVPISRSDWRVDQVGDHLRITFRVVDGERTVASGRDLGELQRRLAGRVRETIADAAADLARENVRSWTFGTLPQVVERDLSGHLVRAYPAVVDCGDSVSVRSLDSAEAQWTATWAGVRRLVRLSVPSPVKPALNQLSTEVKLALRAAPHAGPVELFDDCIDCVLDGLVAEAGGPPSDEAGFTALCTTARTELVDRLVTVLTTVATVVTAARAAERVLESAAGRVDPAGLADVRDHLHDLVHPGFVAATGWSRLADLPRYLRGVAHRLEKLPQRPTRDRDHAERLARVQRHYREFADRLPAGPKGREAARRVRWMIEELRVSYFAQSLGTAHPVSEERILRAMDELAG